MVTVSVVVPTHNRREYLLEALGSVLRQSHSDFEVIVVDDGSTDGTGDAVQSVPDSRVRYVYQTNSGRSAARNRGIALARGQYIAFLDDDDIYLPHRLSAHVGYLDSHLNVDFIGGSAALISTDGLERGLWPGLPGEQSVTLTDALYACRLMPTTVTIRRCAIERLGEGFDSSLEPVEDKDYFLRLLLAGSHAVVQPDVVSKYRIHVGNSQQDASHSTRQNLRCLAKILANPRAPVEIRESERHLRAYYYLSGAFHSYAVGQFDAGQRFLRGAEECDPSFFDLRSTAFLDLLVAFAQTFHVTDAKAFIASVFRHLPDEMAYLRKYRREASAAFHLKRVFDAHAAGERPRMSDWVLGVTYNPRWLWNRGTWSILVRDTFRKRTLSIDRHG